MSEILYKSFERKNPKVAENTYRHIWDNLRANNIRVFRSLDSQDSWRLPRWEDNPRRKLFIPGSSVMRVAAMTEGEFYDITGLNDRGDDKILGNRQVRSSFREANRKYQEYLDAINPLHNLEIRNTKWLLPIGIMGYLLDKIAQTSPTIPELLQGRMVDFMAVPTMLIGARLIDGFVRKRIMMDKIDLLGKDP